MSSWFPIDMFPDGGKGEQVGSLLLSHRLRPLATSIGSLAIRRWTASEWIAVALLAIVAYYLICYLVSPLKDIPGPFLAKFTNFWRVYDYCHLQTTKTQTNLHQKYGSAVRLGPTLVSLNDPALIPVIYNTRGTFLKSDFYTAADALVHGKRIEHIFSTRSNQFHLQQIAPIQKFYSIQGVLEHEDLIDRTLLQFSEQLEKRFIIGGNAGSTCDIGEWISYFAWDLLGELTWSERLGFMEKGYDIKKMIRTGEVSMVLFGAIGLLPWLVDLVTINPYRPKVVEAFDHVISFSYQRLNERLSSIRESYWPKSKDETDYEGDKQDYIADFLEAKRANPGVISNENIVMNILTNISAGTDPMANVQRAIIYHLLRHPSALDTLRKELDAAEVSFPPSYKELHNNAQLPYLKAVIKEGIRMHPIIGLCLERIVPEPGLALPDGRFIPAGQTVGLNPSVMLRNRSIYGPDADVFRPERWLPRYKEPEIAFQERLRRMNELNAFAFGGGNRTCLGQFMATTSLYKVTAMLVSRYDISLADPNEEWEVRSHWMVYNNNIKVKLAMRSSSVLV